MNNNVPIAKEIERKETIGNFTITDNYAWLRDKNWPNKVDDPDVISYLKEENEYAEDFFSKYHDLQEQIFEELKGRIKLTDQTAPVIKDDYYYYSRTEEFSNYSIICRKFKSMDAEEEVILDINKLAKGKDFTKVSGVFASPDHSMIAYPVDFSGDEKFTIRLLDLKTGEYLKDEIKDTCGNVVWSKDGAGFFYVPVDEDLKHTKVRFHKLGEDVSKDKLVFHETDILYNVSIDKSGSEEYLIIRISGHDNNEYRSLSLKNLSSEPTVILPRKEKIDYSVDHRGEYFYIRINDTSSNYRMIRLNLSNWKTEEYLQADKDRYLSDFGVTKSYLILNYKYKGLDEIVVSSFNSNEKKSLSFSDESYTAEAFSTNFHMDDIRINYSSLARPNTLYQYDFDTSALKTLKLDEIPGGFDSSEYQVRRIWADNNGVKVPISLVYKKSLFKKDGSNPLYLYGYGSYGISIPPSFRRSIFSLVDRGFVFAIAHIRGGDDLGYDWYESAKFLTKKRTFEDFIACAEYLIDEKYTSKGEIVIAGGSAGGLLVGASVNQKPELFKAVIAHCPFVDVLSTMLDDTLPLTPGEFKEWGNPKDPEYFEYIKSYSPYDNVEAKSYPAFFVTAGISDPRVGYWEPAKWVAKLRKIKTDNNLIILKTNMDSGHHGASGRFDYLKEIAQEYLFVITRF
ncbi:MAG: S9 family peptidase [Rickettsiaceae bacterium]|nr:S9 family peptidase [Rickettsiaceae bacterium]